jgi:3-oxoacyl-[acyl-carrier protein] reductase
VTCAAEEAKSAIESRIAIKRLGTQDAIAHAIVYLASEHASCASGTVLDVSGGRYM